MIPISTVFSFIVRRIIHLVALPRDRVQSAHTRERKELSAIVSSVDAEERERDSEVRFAVLVLVCCFGYDFCQPHCAGFVACSHDSYLSLYILTLLPMFAFVSAFFVVLGFSHLPSHTLSVI